MKHLEATLFILALNYNKLYQQEHQNGYWYVYPSKGK